MLAGISAFMDKYGMLDGADMLLCAVSGGADSVCLLHAMLSLGLKVKALHFNHLLRGEESDRDEQFVRRLCAGLGVELICGRGDVNEYAAGHRMGTEEAARVLRYRFFESCASRHDGCRVATAHNADDNAETMIMNLTRGAGLSGLTGIPPVRGIYIRPLLCVSRSVIERYLDENGLEHIEDSTNADDGCTRNRIRHHVMPVLRQINPDLARAVSTAAELLREDEKFLEASAAEYAREERLPAEGLPYPIASRAVRLIAERRGARLSKTHVDSVLSLPSGGEISLPGGVKAARSFDAIYFPQERPSAPQPAVLEWNGWVPFGSEGTEVFWGERNKSGKINELFSFFSFKKEEICGKITVRPRMEGDSITLGKRKVTKTLKKLFIEMKIPAEERCLVPVVADERGVLAVGGVGENASRTRPPAADGADKPDRCVVIIAKR